MVSTIRVRHLVAAAPVTILVFIVTLQTPDGGVVHSELVPVRVETDVGDGQVRNVVAARLRDAIERIGGAHRAASRRLDRRERDIASVFPGAARQLVQPGLFDRRALRAAEAARRAIGALVTEAEDRIDALGASAKLTTSIELLAKLSMASRRRP